MSRPIRSAFPARPAAAAAAACLALVAVAAVREVAGAAPPAAPAPQGGPPRVVAWNDLGMHCLDPDFSVFVILPPYNTVQAQVIRDGRLVTSGSGLSVTYEAVADPTGSINRTSIGKTNFWDFEQAVFGVDLPPDTGLAGFSMPGAANVPQDTHFDPTWEWFQAEGVPITPYDDGGGYNTYPLFRVVARDAQGVELASTVATVPNSDEMRCDACHASGGHPLARPDDGWAYDPDLLRDDRLNILALHDDRQVGTAAFQDALSAVGYDPAGLEATLAAGSPILCAACHGSNALPGTGVDGVSPLTAAMHSGHAATVTADGLALDAVGNRNSCYTCHPGLETQCLRGAMGKAVAPDATFSIDCQSCHGSMSAVGDPAREGWFEQPNCQQCHTGTATLNSGAIRFESVFDANGDPHPTADDVFATTPDTPGEGFSLYRFSTGHGGLQCAVCHGSPHAIYPTSEPNDGLQTELVQGHDGTLMECSACHAQLEDTELVGPHGMHPVSDDWASGKHGDLVEQGGAAQCAACHGADGRSTVLSRTHTPRSFTTKFGTATFFEGSNVSCYACHDGPTSEAPTNDPRPSVPNLSVGGPSDAPLGIALGGSDPNGDPLEWRVVDQPEHGKVGLTGSQALFRADPGFVGTTSFTYAAYDGARDSNLGTVTVQVGPPACAGGIDSVGFGCVGSGGFLPYLEADGCPTPGGTVTLSLSNALGGAQALFAVGSGLGAIELAPGCVLRADPLVALTPTVLLAGAGAGQGAFAVDLTFGASAQAIDWVVQAWVIDPGAASLVANSNAVVLEVR